MRSFRVVLQGELMMSCAGAARGRRNRRLVCQDGSRGAAPNEKKSKKTGFGETPGFIMPGFITPFDTSDRH